MSSSNTIRSESTPKCRCGAGDMKLYTSRTQLNPNRKFWKCPNWNNENGCGAFLWKDEVANWQQSEANSSNYERENRREENSKLIAVVEKLERSLRVLIEAENIRNVYLQRIYHAIIVTWCIIILVVMFRYRHYLFDHGSYEEAMEQFLASSVDITYVLSLYPSIVIPKLLAVSEPKKVADFGADTAHLSRGSSDASDEMESSSPSQLVESAEKSALELNKMSHNALMGLVKFLQKKRYGIIESAAAELSEEVASDAVQYSIASFHSHRSKVSSNVERPFYLHSYLSAA